jgi:site-specific DNA-methyltransferase (adenine-specific)/adenine-specific DNA-methyltransferase
MGDASGPGGARKGNPYFEWNGQLRYWRFNKQRMMELEKEGRLAYSSTGIAYIKRYLDESKGVPIQDWWDDIAMLRGIHKNGNGVSYPTQKPEPLLERVVQLSSNPGDLVLDAFAGSGTTCAVAEKLGRRWIGIDCGKLAIYTIQKRMLSLRNEIGHKGSPLKPKPFGLYNAGLYDFSKIKELPWDAWRFFALQLFQCRDEPHKIGGIHLDGYLKGASVLVFNHQKQPGVRIDEETVQSIHEALGSKIGSRMFIIAPALVFDFQQDYLTQDGVRYYALRIPYSIIHELHQREFAALKQPADELAVNDTVDAVGFDFIRSPELDYVVTANKRKGELLSEGVIRIKTFKSEAVVRDSTKKGNRETLSMVMFDYDFDTESDVFDLDAVFYAEAIQKSDWEVRFPLESVGKQIMAVFVDIYGNEAREVIPASKFGVGPRKAEAKPAKKARKKAKK